MAQHLRNVRRREPNRRPHHNESLKSRSIYETVTARISEALEAGVVPWRKPWQASTALPCNAVTNRPYRGINLLLLGLARYQDHRWLTYRQAAERGGHVRLGERASMAVLWKPCETERTDESGEERRERFPVLRFYNVFNVQQCDGLNLPDLDQTTKPAHQRIEAAESVVRAMPDPPKMVEGRRQACYYPALDTVEVPSIGSFETPDAYYATLFHELGHATGHESRLNRPAVTAIPGFGTADYSREELVAELASSFCCAAIGLDNSLIDNAASYIQGWMSALKTDQKAIVVASGQGQRAADYIRGITPDNGAVLDV